MSQSDNSSLPVEDIAKAVSRAVTTVLSKRKRKRSSSSSASSGESVSILPARPESKKKRKKHHTTCLPSSFLQKRAQASSSQRSNSKGKEKLIRYDRAIVCLPKSYSRMDSNKIPVPRDRESLSKRGLIGRISLLSSMSQAEIFGEIRNVFRRPMNGSSTFRFEVLQATGGSSKSLTLPALSSKYEWNASSIVPKNAKSALYIRAKEPLVNELTDSSSEEIGEELPSFANVLEKKPASVSNCKKADIIVIPATDDKPTCSKYLQPPSQYKSFINLLSSDEDIFSASTPSPPPHSPITPEFKVDAESLSNLLKDHKRKVVNIPISQALSSAYRLKIRRSKVFQDGIREFKHGFPLDQKFCVTFIGEPAVDTGGPLREFFHLLMIEVANNNSLFEGSDGRVPVMNVIELEKKTYFYVGQIIALSLLHGGPAPSFFSKAVATFFSSSEICASANDVADAQIRNSIEKLEIAKDKEAFQELVSSGEYDFCYECGVQAMKYEDRSAIVTALYKYFAIIRCLPQLQQLKEGLSTLGVLELLQQNQLVHQLFTVQAISVTSNELYDLFCPQFSPEGSNRREAEVTAVYNWANYLQSVAGGTEFIENECDKVKQKITLLDIVRFATGAGTIPPLGFIPNPSIAFHDCNGFPRGNTCANQIVLPLFLDEASFNRNVTFGILNAVGFGQV